MDGGVIKYHNVELPDEASKVDVITQTILSFGVKVNKTLIFVNTRETAEMLKTALLQFNFDPVVLHSSLSEEQRGGIIHRFHKDHYYEIVTTDLYIDSRIDLSLVNVVIHYDLPIMPSTEEAADDEPDVESYLQRSSIKGPGCVFNLLCGTNKDRMIMEKIQGHPNLISGNKVVTTWKSVEDFRSAYIVGDTW